MTQTAINYARVLYELSIPAEAVEETKELLLKTSQLCTVLTSPIVKKIEKHRIIDKLFPASMGNFLKLLCDSQEAYLLQEICQAYEEYSSRMNGILTAELYYVTMPSKEQLSGIEETLKTRYHAGAVKLILKEDKSLIGGFRIRCGDKETDLSFKGRLRKLEQSLIGKGR